MPLYQYQDTRTGRVRELWRPMRLRDRVPAHLQRVMVAPALNVRGQQGLANLPEIDAKADALRGFKQVEETHGAGYIERTLGMSTNQIKDVWNKPQSNPVPVPA